MTSLEKRIQNLFELHLGIYYNLHGACLSMADFAITTSASLQQEDSTPHTLAVCSDFTITDFIHYHQIRRVSDVNKIDREGLWQLFQMGKAEVYCGLDDDAFWFQKLISVNETLSQPPIVVRSDEVPSKIIHEPLTSPDDFLDFSIKLFNEKNAKGGHLKVV